METLYKVFVSIIPPVVGILVYVFIESKRKARTKTMPVQNAETLLDDVSYIQEIKHLHGAVGIAFWKQYDVLLAAQHYGWETMVDWAAYMESADIDKIDSIAVADLNDDTGIELAHVYNLNKVGLKNFERLVEEHGILRLKDAIEYFGVQSHFFMMLDDIGSSGTSCSKLIMRKAKPRTVPPQRGSFFYVGNKNENSALIKLETVNTSPHGYNRQALRLSIEIEVVGLGHRKDCLNA